MGDSISADLIVNAVVNGFDKIEGALNGAATSSDELTATQNKLAQAIFNAETAAINLADAQRELDAYTGDNAATQRELEGAVLDAKVGMDNAVGAAQELATEYKELQDRARGAGESSQSLGGRLMEDMQGARMGMRAFNFVTREVQQGLKEVYDTAKDLGRTDVTAAFDGATAAGRNLKDVLLSIPVGGRSTLDWFRDAANGAKNSALAFGALEIKWQEFTHQIDHNTAVELTNTLVTGKAAQAVSGWGLAYAQSQSAILGVAMATQQAIDPAKELANAQTLLAASMNGNLGPAYADTKAKQSDMTAELKKTQTELDKLNKYQGQTVTVTKNATTTQAEMNVALDKQVVAANNLAAAQKKLGEYTGDDANKHFQLSAAVNAAALGVEHANAAVDKFTDGLGKSSTATVDNSKRIKELTDKKEALQAAIDSAAASEKKLTDEFIFNQAASSLDAKSQLDLAEKMKLIDHASYNAAKGVLALKEKFSGPDGVIKDQAGFSAALIQAGKDMETYGVVLDTQISPKAQVASDAIAHMSQQVAQTPNKKVVFDTSSIPGPAQVASDAIDRVIASMAKATSKHVSFVTDLIENHIINYSQTGAAGAQGTAGYLGAHGAGHAAGGPVSAGVAYPWNEPGAGPEILIPAGNGYVLNQRQAQQALAMAAGGGQINNPGMSVVVNGGIHLHDVGTKNTTQLVDELLVEMGRGFSRYQRSGARALGRQ